MKRTAFLLLLTLVSAISFAQERKISGTLIDRDTKEPMMQTTVQLLKMDSTFVAGTISDEKGKFSVQAPENGKYLLRISSIGYITSIKRLEMVEDHDLVMGDVVMNSDAVMLKGATVTGQAMKVVLREDTFVYNSAAYVTPEGSVVEELVKRLPGAQVSDDGKITINGKEVKKVKVGGKEFMTGDTQTAMKNLPTSIIENIKVYDEKSDLSRITGIDDGNEETVLDFTVKRGMDKGLMTNADLGYGTHERYSGRLFGMYRDSKFRIQGMGNANNTGDRGFGGRGGGGRGGQGLNSSKMAGVNFNFDNDTIEIGGSVRWNHRDGDSKAWSSSESFVSRSGAFSNSIRQNYSRSDSWNAQMRLEWKPDTMTNIMFRPSMSISTNDGLSSNNSGSYSKDPYQYVADPLAIASIAQLAKDSIMVNTENNNNINYSDSKRFGGNVQINRKLNSEGRNVTFRAEGNYTKGNSTSLSTSNVHLYKILDVLGLDSTYQTNRYNLTPTKTYNYSLRATYSEPLWKATFLQLSYQFNYSTNKSDRSTYNFSNLGENFFSSVPQEYRGWDSYLNRLERPFVDYYDKSLSRYSEYKNYTHDIELQFRMVREKFNFNVGVLVQPQKSNFIQDYRGIYKDTVRTVTNISPTLNFRYRFSKVSNLRINYRSNTTQPSISQMLDIYDDSNPLNISTGNPGLKPSFTQRLNAFYNGYVQNHMRTMMSFVNFTTTNNSISSKVTYNETTGGRITRPENINGNWSVQTGFMYNQSIDTVGVWFLNTFTDFGYSNHVGYVSLDRTSDSQKNTTRDLRVGERLALSFRPQWGLWATEFEIDGSGTYNHARNELQTQGDLDTWEFAYGGSINVTAPWGTSLSVDLHNRSRRGYNDHSMNTNELIWNAQISQGFLKGRALTISLQLYDLLQQQSNFSRAISAMNRSDTYYNSINSYAMVHVIYRFNLFGGKSNNSQEGMFGPGGMGMPRGNGGGPGGGNRGGFGGPGGGGRPMGRIM
ncbi:MAG: outer membrane beta-barrel protein [Prevotella sp.]|nr:outer membrane beta-barrel protein [Prevotella sp.]